MKAIVQDRYGSADVLALREVDDPVVTDNGVLVRIRAAAVNAADWHIMRGDPYLARASIGLRRPKARIRGRDFAGQVEAVGKAVTRFQPGDEVYGELGDGNGSFAEYTVVAEDLVERKPANLTFEQAAALPLAGITALMGLREVGQVKPGQRVLINGASGGVGLFAVQLGKAFGAEVTGVCSAKNADLVRSVGADQVIDYAQDDFTRNGTRYDLVFDLVGNRSLTELRRALTPAGTLVLSGGGVSNGGSLLGPIGLIAKGSLLSWFVRQRMIALVTKPTQERLATLRELAESGQLTPVIDRTYPLREAAEAIRYLELEHARAKVIVTM